MKTEKGFLNDLYTIKDIQEDHADHKVTVKVELNPAHDVFKGHFPGSPVLPGVCTVQIVKELLAHYLKKDLLLKKAGTIKYLSFINPEANRMIDIDLQLKDMGEGLLTCNAKVYYEATVFCSFRGEYMEAP